MDVHIRKATSCDTASAWNIRNAAILAQCTGHYPEELLIAWTDGAPTEYITHSVAKNWYVATIDEEVVATGLLDIESGQIDAIFVRPDMMGKGIGTRMMVHLEDIAMDAGLAQLTLNSTINAAPFYRKCGFYGDQRSQYKSPHGISLSCIPMRKELQKHSGTG